MGEGAIKTFEGGSFLETLNYLESKIRNEHEISILQNYSAILHTIGDNLSLLLRERGDSVDVCINNEVLIHYKDGGFYLGEKRLEPLDAARAYQKYYNQQAERLVSTYLGERCVSFPKMSLENAMRKLTEDLRQVEVRSKKPNA